MTTLKQLRQRRDNGIAFLDSRVPNWREETSTETLDMSSSCGCILWQATGLEYDEALVELELSNDESAKCAFYTGKKWLDYDTNEEIEREYAKLTKVWKEVL